MILTKEQKEKIRNIGIFEYSGWTENGREYQLAHGKKEEFIVPQFSETLKAIYGNILKLGFSKVEQCKPSKANCIIRVYQELYHKHDGQLFFSLYGACCYTKVKGKWITNCYANPYHILKYDKHISPIFLIQNETVIFEPTFMDCYVRISS